MKSNFRKFAIHSRKISYLVAIMLLFSYQNLLAKEFTITNITESSLLTITGIVTGADDGEPLIGATVAIKGAKGDKLGTITEFDGSYALAVEANDTLIFSYTGMETTEVAVDGRSVVNVAMKTLSEIMDEVVVVGYGKVKKSHLTGSISKVKNDGLDQIPMSRVDDALVGQVSGVNIQMTNPAAGEAPTIRIRGQGSISFDSNPLIVVDGITVGNDADFLSSLDMNDVESVEVLKDAASSAIYGSRGANGIIMITTKQGKEGPTRFSYDSYVGFKSVPKTDVLTTPQDWFAYTRANNGGVLTDKLDYVEKLGTHTDWEEVMMDGGVIHSHALSARGGTKNTKFRASLSYLDDEGVLLTDNYNKINFKIDLNTKVSDRVSFGIRLNPSHTKQRRFPIGVHDAIRQSGWLPLYLDEGVMGYVNGLREDGRWSDAQIGDYAMERMFDDYDLINGEPVLSGTDISATSNQNSLAKVLERRRIKYQTKIYANAFVNINLTKDLFIKQTIGGDFRYTRNTRWAGVKASRNESADSESTRSTDLRLHGIAETTLNFSKEMGKHELDAVGGFAFESWNRESSDLEAAGFDFDYIQTIPAANLVGGSTYESEEKLLSFLSRFNYSYDGKYLLSLSARWDGSSKFGPDNKYGFFPAISAGWRISEEKFLKDNDIIDELKVRFSYGVTGSNSGIGEYDFIGLVAPVGTGLGGNNTGYNPLNIANSELRWEKLIEYNPGIDVTFLEGRFGLSFDYYNRRSEDLLLDLPIPSATGFETALVNKGVVENKGIELEIISKNYTSKNFTWSTSLNITHNKNTLVDFVGNDGLISIVDDKRASEWIALEGNPISSFYGYVVSHDIALEYIKNPFYPIHGQSQDIYVKDLNGDGIIDTDDRTVLGSPYPDFIWSVTNNIRFMKRFDMTFMFQGSHGAEVRNISSQYIRNEFSSNQDYTDEFPDKDLVVQRIFTNDDIQDASYVALRNFNIGYTFNTRTGFLDKAGIRKLRVYVGAQNLIYIMSKGYDGYNPEGADQGRGNPLTAGYQRGPAPIYRTISLGLNLSF